MVSSRKVNSQLYCLLNHLKVLLHVHQLKGELIIEGKVAGVPYINSCGENLVLLFVLALFMKAAFCSIEGQAYLGRFSSAITHLTIVLIV